MNIRCSRSGFIFSGIVTFNPNVVPCLMQTQSKAMDNRSVQFIVQISLNMLQMDGYALGWFIIFFPAGSSCCR